MNVFAFFNWLAKDLFYRCVRHIARLLVVCLCEFRAVGRPFLEEHEGAMLLSTHQSMLDPVLVGICFNGRLNYVARKTLFRNSLFAFLILALDSIEIDRERGGLAGLREMLKRLQNNKKVLLFPEGTRSENGEIGELKMGFIPIARRSEVPIIPIAIVGANRILPRGRIIPQRQPLAVVIGKPILTSEILSLTDEQLRLRLAADLAACKAQGEQLLGTIRPNVVQY